MEEMNELYYRSPYTKEFEAEVIACTETENGYEVMLSDTAFYPEGGGQPSDQGTLNGIKVTDVQRKENGIVHVVDAPIELGTKVHGILDWERRFMHMQEHSGEHLVSGLVHRKYGYENVGFHMGEMIQIDFSGPLDEAQLRMIENEANEVIWKNEPIEVSYPDSNQLEQMDYRSKKELKGCVRIVTIPDGDVCACCGTHVASTGEIGSIRIVSCEKHKNGVRVQMLAGKRALQFDQGIFDADHVISALLSSKLLETDEAVKKLLQQNNEQKYQIGGLMNQLIAYKLDAFKCDQNLLSDFEEGMERDAMRQLAVDMVEKKNAAVGAVLSKDGDHYGYVILSHTVPLKKYRQLLNDSLHGQGGGTDEILQGSFASCREDIQGVLEQLFL